MTSRRVARIGVVLGVVAGSACSATGNASPPSVSNAHARAADAGGLAKHADALLAASAAIDYERPFRGKPRDLAPVIAAYLDACRAGDGRSCRRAVDLEHQAGEDNGPALHALVEHCRAGQLDTCRALLAGAAIADDHALAGWAGRSETCKERGCDDELRRECKAGFAASCFVLVGHGVPDDDAVFARAGELAVAGCRADIGPECQLLGQADEDKLLRHGHSCQLRGVDCTTYGLDLRADPVAARDVFERACQYDQAHQVDACKVLVEVYQENLVPEPMPGRARAVRDWVCAQPNPWHDFCAHPVSVPPAPGG